MPPKRKTEAPGADQQTKKGKQGKEDTKPKDSPGETKNTGKNDIETGLDMHNPEMQSTCTINIA